MHLTLYEKKIIHQCFSKTQENPKQNNSKPNPAVYKSDDSLESNGLYFRKARWAYYLKNNVTH
jgi:hypothetical protein